MALTGTRFSGSLSPGYFKRLKQEEAQRSLVGGQAISGETLEGLTGKALGDVYGERMRSLQQSHQQKYGQMDLDVAERKLKIEEEAQENKALGEKIAGIGTAIGTVATFIPGVGMVIGPAITAASKLASRAVSPSSGAFQPLIQPFKSKRTTMRMDAPFKSTPEMQYGPTQKGVESQWPSEARYTGATQESTTSTGESIWPSETRFMNMGSQLLFGSGNK